MSLWKVEIHNDTSLGIVARLQGQATSAEEAGRSALNIAKHDLEPDEAAKLFVGLVAYLGECDF